MKRLRIALLLGLLAILKLPARADDAFHRTGTFALGVADDFANARAEFHYELRTDDGEILRLNFAEPPEGLRTGDRIAVHGRPRAGGFEVDEVEPLRDSRAVLAREPLSTWTVGAKRVLVILLNFTNDTSLNATTVTNAQNLFFGVGSSVARFYNESSYGLVTMTGDVALVTATVAKPTTCDTTTVQTQANNRATAAGYNLASYNFLVWVFPALPCGWNGMAYVGWSGAWINGTGSMGLLVTAHELGHNFGVLHAHSYDCGTLTIAPSGCTRSEYGDRFDVMGNSRAGHFNAQFKDTFGWLPAGRVRVHGGGGTATYTIGALEAPGESAYAVRIPTAMSGRTYWIEWRNRTGFDAGEPTTVVNGGLIRLAPSAVGGSDLLDMKPATTTFDDSELDVGATFTDPELLLTITTLSKTATSLTVQVDYHTPPPATSFHTLTPCRAFDTRNADGPYGGPAIAAGFPRTFVIRGRCGVPATAKSIAGNFTVTSPTAAGSLRVVPGGAGTTGTSTVNFSAGQTRANNLATGLGAGGDLLVDGLGSGTVHAIFDVVGWFE